jgi:hypothetical protein
MPNPLAWYRALRELATMPPPDAQAIAAYDEAEEIVRLRKRG